MKGPTIYELLTGYREKGAAAPADRAEHAVNRQTKQAL